MTISADGYIARPNDEAPWSPEEFTRCNEFVAAAGNIIVGRRTYEIMKEAGDLNREIRTVVLSHSPHEDVGNVHFVASPEEAIAYLKNKNFEAVVVAGGTATNTAFLTANLIDEVMLDVEPIILGEGLRLFEEGERDVKMQVIENTKLDGSTVRSHYRIVKN